MGAMRRAALDACWGLHIWFSRYVRVMILFPFITGSGVKFKTQKADSHG